jgi:hypothetical protein
LSHHPVGTGAKKIEPENYEIVLAAIIVGDMLP